MNKTEIIEKINADDFESCDWAHNEEKRVFYNGEDYSGETTLKEGGILLTENMPWYQVQKYKEDGIFVLGVHVNLLKDWKEKHGISTVAEKQRPTDRTSDKIDAKAIYDCGKEHPEWFREIQPQSLQLQYNNFYQMQKAKVAMGLRLWASGTMSDESVAEQKSLIEQLMKNIVDTIGDTLEKEPVWNLYLDNVPYIGPSLGGGLVSMGNVTRFETPSKLRKFAGLAVLDGKTQRHTKGETGGYNDVFKMLLLGRIATQFIKSKGMKVPSEYLQDYVQEKEKLQRRSPQQIPVEDKVHIVGDILSESVGSMKSGQRIYKTNYTKLVSESKKENRSSVLIQLSPGHIHAMASRKMMVLFLEDYWVISRQLLGYPTVPPYPQSVLQHNGYRPPRYIPEILKPFDPIRDWGWIFKNEKRDWNDADEFVRMKCDKEV